MSTCRRRWCDLGQSARNKKLWHKKKKKERRCWLTTTATNGSWNVDLWVVCLRLFLTASIHSPDANDTIPQRSPTVLPTSTCISVLHPPHINLHDEPSHCPGTYSTIYSFASFAAFTLVSVPCTGSAKESMIQASGPLLFLAWDPWSREVLLIAHGWPSCRIRSLSM